MLLELIVAGQLKGGGGVGGEWGGRGRKLSDQVALCKVLQNLLGYRINTQASNAFNERQNIPCGIKYLPD